PVTEGEGGRFGDLNAEGRRVTGDELTPHHMTADKRHFLPRDEGGAVMMRTEDHMLTRTWGTRGRLLSEAEEKAGVSFRDTLARDIRDIRQIGASKRGSWRFYNKGVQDMMKYYRDQHPELLVKPPR